MCSILPVGGGEVWGEWYGAAEGVVDVGGGENWPPGGGG